MDISKEMLEDFWKMIGFEQGTNRIVINNGSVQTYLNDFFLLNQNGQYYIHDKINNKLYDQFLNYYQDGIYYNIKNEKIQDIPNDNIIDADPNKVYKKYNNIVEHFDSNGNQYTLTPQEAFDKYGPDDDRFYTSQGLDPIEQRKKINELNSKRKPVKTDEEIFIKQEEYDKFEQGFKDILNDIEKFKKESTPKYKAVKGPKLKEKVIEEATEELPKKQLTKASTEAIENGVKNINFKKIGKIGAVVAAVGLAAYGIGKHSKNKKQEEEHKQQTYQQNNQQLLTRLQQTSNQPIDNSYSMQLASDISSYRYGKQMTGFI